jgi:hypothetical protein
VLAALLAGDLYFAFEEVDWVWYPPEVGGFEPTINIGRLIERGVLIATLMILASVGNFQYEVYAKPVGYQYRKVQSQPPAGDDPVGQVDSGMLIEKKITDALCYSQPDCNIVAQNEIDVIKAQRDRASITKVAHIQDEIADTISVIHPISTQAVNLFITEITRRHRKGQYFLDDIQGWKVN